MTTVRKLRDVHNWRSLCRVWILIHPNLTFRDRSLEDIGTRSLALSEKGKVARMLDKSQDAQEVIGLVEKLRQAILVYQVSTRHYRRRKWLTSGIGIATTVYLQPGRPSDREFLFVVSDFEAEQVEFSRHLLIRF